MPKNTETVVDPDAVIWTKERFDRSVGFNELPEHVRERFRDMQRGRGPQKAPTKQPVTIRLSQDVLTVLRGKGRGWQTLVDQTLREKFLNAKA